MNVKELKEFLNNFPDDAEVWCEANNHYSEDGITNASLLNIIDDDYPAAVLIIGNTSQADYPHGGYGNWDDYNIGIRKYIKTWNDFDGFKEYNEEFNNDDEEDEDDE